MLGTFAEYERTLIIERVEGGMEKRAKSGRWNGGVILGYDTVDKKLVINDDESKVVNEIFELRTTRLGYKAIANSLNRQEKKTKKNNDFSINAVKTILENRTYIGQLNWGSYRKWEEKRRSGKTDPISSEGKHDPIIDVELRERVQEVSRRNRESSNNIKNIKSDFLLSGILKCPVCGAGTVMSKSQKRDKTGYRLYYMCQNYHTKGREVCSSNLINKEMIEEKVLKTINGLVSNNDIVNEILDKISNDKNTDTLELQKQIWAIKKELIAKQKEQSKIDADYFSNDITAKSYGRLSEKIEEEVERLQEVNNNLEDKYEKILLTYSIDEKIVK
ncbi:recombinase family protein [Sediminibacillus dalangtanensis]|uniref:Recombinase family protein n=2 Tax=Sediminibacillus dalangtanensis TaxID=2729421 RepID=A0ABX7VS47_9BACI|nr:recombinase family protein [Sediminibacillus dalangtanensis]